MAAESAVLGTPALYVNSLGMGYTDELESRYGLLEHFDGEARHRRAVERAVAILDGEVGGGDGRNGRDGADGRDGQDGGDWLAGVGGTGGTVGTDDSGGGGADWEARRRRLLAEKRDTTEFVRAALEGATEVPAEEQETTSRPEAEASAP